MGAICSKNIEKDISITPTPSHNRSSSIDKMGGFILHCNIFIN